MALDSCRYPLGSGLVWCLFQPRRVIHSVPVRVCRRLAPSTGSPGWGILPTAPEGRTIMGFVKRFVKYRVRISKLITDIKSYKPFSFLYSTNIGIDVACYSMLAYLLLFVRVIENASHSHVSRLLRRSAPCSLCPETCEKAPGRPVASSRHPTRYPYSSPSPMSI